jgi:hypothetical protein
MYNGSTILLCVTIFVIHKRWLIGAHCSIVTVAKILFTTYYETMVEKEVAEMINGITPMNTKQPIYHLILGYEALGYVI